MPKCQCRVEGRNPVGALPCVRAARTFSRYLSALAVQGLQGVRATRKGCPHGELSIEILCAVGRISYSFTPRDLDQIIGNGRL